MSEPAELSSVTDPEKPLATWNVEDALDEMEAACRDASGFLKQMATNEQTRKCWWQNKTGTGKKANTKTADAKPFNGAADHEVHLTQTVMNRRNAARLAALSAGNLNVTPMESTDAKRAGLMRQVLRYYLNGPMRTEFTTQGLRAGSYADRFRAAVMYVGWKEERGVEAIPLNKTQIAEWLQMQAAAEAQDMTLLDGIDFEALVMDPERDDGLVELILSNLPGVAERRNIGKAAVKRALNAIRLGDENAVVHAAYVKRSSPCWEALQPFVDVFFPYETLMEDGLESCRWIARVRWRSAQWIREQAALNDWDKAWVKEVLDKHKGRSALFSNSMASYPWALSGAGVNWSARTNGEAQNHLYQIIELWDRSMTSDGLTGTYHTVMHADVKERVAKRSLRMDWDGAFPFVPFTFSPDERLILDGFSVPEITMTKEQAVKAQWDSRTDAASLTTFPTWTGDPELEGMRPAPGVFLPSIRGKVPTALQIPPPDGRSIEIERTVRESVNEFFGFPSKTVPDSMAMMMGQADLDWFMLSISQCIARTARLIQQYMPPLQGARITGTNELITATAQDVRGGFDFQAKFNVKSLDVEWTSKHLGFIKDMIVPLDNRGQINTLPILEAGFNMLDPGLAAQCLPKDADTAQRQTLDMARMHLAEIFTGGAPEVTEGMDFGGLAQAVTEEVTRSPLRQQSVIGGQQIHVVLTSYLSGLVNNQKQHGGENAQIGRTLTEDPLAQPSAAEQLLQTLQQLPDGVSLAQMMQQPQPMN
jgi:hypothetical protein